MNATKTLVRDKSIIPLGCYCYSKTRLSEDGYTLKLLDLCPYWGHTDHGTVRCEYLQLESVNNSEEDYQKALEYFGSEEELDKQAPLFILWDQVKECGINDDWD